MLNTITAIPIWEIAGLGVLFYLLLQLALPIYFLFFHVIPLWRLKNRLREIEKKVVDRNFGRGITTEEVNRQIVNEQHSTTKEMKEREYKRQLTLDWINTVLAIKIGR